MKITKFYTIVFTVLAKSLLFAFDCYCFFQSSKNRIKDFRNIEIKVNKVEVVGKKPKTEVSVL